MTTTYFLLATCVAAREKKAATKLLIVNKKNKILTIVVISQLTNAVFISQRHKIESSGFLTIDVLYKKNRRERNM